MRDYQPGESHGRFDRVIVRYIVTAIEARANNVKYLKTHIPNLEVVWDEKRDAMDTFLRACVASYGSSVVRLEDDVCLTVDFTTKAEAVIAKYPLHVIQFFSRSKYDLTVGTRFKNGGTFSNVITCLKEHRSIWLSFTILRNGRHGKQKIPTATIQ